MIFNNMNQYVFSRKLAAKSKKFKHMINLKLYFQFIKYFFEWDVNNPERI